MPFPPSGNAQSTLSAPPRQRKSYRTEKPVAGPAFVRRKRRAKRSVAPASPAATSAEPAPAAAARAAFLGPGLVHRERASPHLLAVQRGDRRLRLLVGAHLDEAEAFRLPGGTISDHLRRAHRAVRREQLLQVRVAD